ncbi:MAG: ABC transporter ATP-binding protein [Phycisphaerales bacterium]|nr:MAG: ABC transporter ATP-binding protein [Phycisphaerales bacterium]
MASVSLENVTKTFGRGRGRGAALDRFSLHAEREYVAVVGPSGCGKTTLLRLVAGLEVPDSGTVRIGGQDMRDVPPRRRDVSMVFQSDALYPHMSVRSNIAFPLRVRKVGRAEVDARIHWMAGQLGLEHLLQRRPRELSGGQRQRVALARAMIRRPAVLLLDEPLGHLDSGERLRARGLIRALHRELGGTTLHVTHDQEEAMALADRLVVMLDGQVRQSGPPWELYRHPRDRFVAQFLGSAPMNFVEGSLTADGEATAFDGGGLRVVFSSGRFPPSMAPAAAILGIRPEDVAFQAAERAETECATRDGAAGRAGGDRTVVEAVETVAGRRHVVIRTGAGARLLAEARDHAVPGPGASVDLHLPPDRVSVFSPGEHGRNLEVGSGGTERSAGTGL